jgi:hypothetical protein
MNTIKRSLLASLMLTLALPALAAADLPFILTGIVRDASDGTSAAGMKWTAWSDAAPRVRLSGRLGDEIVGAVRPGAFYGDIGSSAAAVGGQWTVVVQGMHRGRTYAAVTRGPISGHPAVFAPMTLAVLPRMVVGVDFSRLGGAFRPHGNGGSVGGGIGELPVAGDRVRRSGARVSVGQPALSLCSTALGGTQVVSDGAPADAACLPLLRASSTAGTLSR